MFEDIFGDFDRQIERVTNIDDTPVQAASNDVWQTDIWTTADNVDPDAIWGKLIQTIFGGVEK